MKRNSTKKWMTGRHWGYGKGGLSIFLCFLLCLSLLPIQARAADPTVTYLYVSYLGGSVTVGQSISEEDIRVLATYSDGSTEEVTNYAIATKTVTREGINTFTVFYKGATANFMVIGKRAVSISATYFGNTVISSGNSVGKENVVVMVHYTDGSVETVKDFTLVNAVIQTVGSQSIRVVYGGLTTSFNVTGIAAKNVSSLFASYQGGQVIQGNAVKSEDLIVTAVYTDNTTERIYNYSFSPQVVSDVGTNRVTVIYRGATANFEVECIVRTLESITAAYEGTAVEVGRYVDPKEITVVGKYNDGSTEEMQEFSLLGDRILTLGNNRVTVNCYGLKDIIIVQGVANVSNTFDHTSAFRVTNGTQSANVQISLPKTVETDIITGRSRKLSTVQKVMSKVDAQDAEYIAFDVILTDETEDDIFPLQLRVTLPASFPADDTVIYYTPNRKTVIGRMSSERISSRILEITIYQAGTYIISYQEAEEYIEEEDEDEYLD